MQRCGSQWIRSARFSRAVSLLRGPPQYAIPLRLSMRCVHPTPVILKDVYKNDRKDSRRLTYAERSERRTGATQEQKGAREQRQAEAEMIVHNDFPEELESLYARASEKAGVCAMKVLNMAKCLELLEVEMAGGHSVLLTKVAQVIKVAADRVVITPNSSSFANNILQRVSRFDSSVQVSREGSTIKVVLQPITTGRRDKAASDIAAIITSFRAKVKQARTNAGKLLQDYTLDETLHNELASSLDSTANAFVTEKVAELELLAEEVMSMGIDESDASVATSSQ